MGGAGRSFEGAEVKNDEDNVYSVKRIKQQEMTKW